MCFRKRRAQRKSPISIPVAVLDLDEEENTRKGINYRVSFSFNSILFDYW